MRFTDEMFARLDQASARTGMPVNSIVIAACLEWMQRHTPVPGEQRGDVDPPPHHQRPAVAPRWATLRRAVKLAIARPEAPGIYPFERFSDSARELLTIAQREAEQSGHSYIGTEHLLLAAFGNPEFLAAKILANMGIEQAAARTAIEVAIGANKPGLRRQIIPTSRVKRVIEMAFNLCGSLGDPRVGTNHLLLALAAEGEGIAAHVLNDLGAPKDRIESEMAQLTEPEA